MQSNNSSLGREGEQLVSNYYEAQGYHLVARNFQYYHKGIQGRLGEIDLIMANQSLLCFVEVKTRSSTQFGLPAAQIDRKKLKHIFKTFQYFMSKHPQFQKVQCRFDVAEVLNGQINVIPNAYSFEEFWLN